MAFTGELVIENFQYGVQDVEFPAMNPDGTPTGEVVPRRCIVVVPTNAANEPVGVTLQMRIEPGPALDQFVKLISGHALVVANEEVMRQVQSKVVLPQNGKR